MREPDAGDALPPPPSMARGARGASPRAERGQERLTAEQRMEKRERDELRRERQRERERELRLAEKNRAVKGSKLTRDRDRDVSEKIALGQANVRSGEVLYDSRLFNREGGMGSGFRGDDNTAVYDKALFADRSALGMYRARDRLDDEVYGGRGGGGQVDTGRFRPDRGFAGTDDGATERSGPVQFEKTQEADPFGIDGLLGGVGTGR
jgi:SNW domain-containing protein 1